MDTKLAGAQQIAARRDVVRWSELARWKWLDTPRDAMVVLDIEARWRGVYPLAEKYAPEAGLAPQKFLSAVKSLQRDGARELT